MAVSKLNPVSGGVTPKVFTYTTPGVSTFTLPSGYGAGNPLRAEVTILAAGGSAGKGYYNSGTNMGAGGGGGAGGIFKGELALTSNMNVQVGRGGACYGTNTIHGGNGELSYIGNGTPKNLFINPQFIGLTSALGSSMIELPFAYSIGVLNIGSAVRGNVMELQNWGSISAWNGQTYAVKPSTQYTFSMHNFGGTSQFRYQMQFFTADGTFISTSSGSTITSNTSAWNRGHVGDTSPSTAVYCTLRVEKVSGTSTTYFSNPQFEEGVTSPTTYVDGDSSGYVWGGVKTGSATFLASEVMYVANGGGGGGGIVTDGASDSRGFSGGCSGGGAIKTTSSTRFLSAGNGGGLGGNAAHLFNTPASGSIQSGMSPYYNYHNRFADFGFGSNGLTFSTNEMNLFRGISGPASSDGYGKGGTGTLSRSDSLSLFAELWFNDVNNSDWLTRTRNFVSGKPNTGDGGSSLNIGQNTGSGAGTGVVTGNGGSGLVIIKYWS
jgi:hypothetical protein